MTAATTPLIFDRINRGKVLNTNSTNDCLAEIAENAERF